MPTDSIVDSLSYERLIHYMSMVFSPAFLRPPFAHSIVLPDTIQTQYNSAQTRHERQVICALIAALTLDTFSIPSLVVHYRPCVVDLPENEVENVAGDDGRQSHRAPVLAEAVNTECVRYKAREYAE